MSQQVAVVTGGTRGIGLSITKKLIAEGYKVAVIYNGNEEAAKKCENDTGAKSFKADVTDFDGCMKTCADIESSLGPISVLVNNAGVTKDGMLHKMGKDSWDFVLATNLTSCFIMCRAVVAGMRERGYGRIINISSINGQKGQMGQVNYAAAKAGMLGFTKSLAIENAAKGITVNAICPGYIETDMTAAVPEAVLESIIKQIPVGRMGTPDEVADYVAFLAAPSNAFTTGATFTVNGGQYMAA
jgi:acetoacetyl-CoA reductase